MPKRVIYFLCAIGVVAAAVIPALHIAGKLQAAKTQNYLLLSVLCNDKKILNQKLKDVPLPPDDSEYALPDFDNKDLLWSEIKSATLSECKDPIFGPEWVRRDFKIY